MADLWVPVVAAFAGLALAVAIALWRLVPAVRGRARVGDTLAERLEKWNRFIGPAVRQAMKGRLHVADAWPLPGGAEGVAAWPLSRSLLPDVTWVAIARPPAPDAAAPGTDEQGLLGVIRAAELRALLHLGAPPQQLWGHSAWLYAWPADADVNAVVGQLVPIGEFRERFGWQPPPALRRVQAVRPEACQCP